MKRLMIFLSMVFFACTNSNNMPAEGEMIPLLSPAAQLEPYNDGSGLIRVTNYGTDGTVLEQGDYLNDLREGVYTVFHPKNGYVLSTTGYIHGKKQGQSIIMDDRGQVQERFTYHNDVLNGPYVKYNRTRLKETREYSNGLLEGEVEKFYPNGKVMERTNYVNGQLDGISRWYDQNGNNTIAYDYKNGELIGDVELEIVDREPVTN